MTDYFDDGPETDRFGQEVFPAETATITLTREGMDVIADALYAYRDANPTLATYHELPRTLYAEWFDTFEKRDLVDRSISLPEEHSLAPADYLEMLADESLF